MRGMLSYSVSRTSAPLPEVAGSPGLHPLILAWEYKCDLRSLCLVSFRKSSAYEARSVAEQCP